MNPETKTHPLLDVFERGIELVAERLDVPLTAIWVRFTEQDGYLHTS